jgi:hypothetical protein
MQQLKSYQQIHFYTFDRDVILQKFCASTKIILFYLDRLVYPSQPQPISKRLLSLSQTVVYHLQVIHQLMGTSTKIMEILTAIGPISMSDEFVENVYKYWYSLPIIEKYAAFGLEAYPDMSDYADKIDPRLVYSITSWGPRFWVHLHLASILAYANDNSSAFGQLMASFDVLLPCGECQRNFMDKHPFETLTIPIQYTHDSITPLLMFHNQVSLATNRPAFSVQQLADVYGLKVTTNDGEHPLSKYNASITEAISNETVPTYNAEFSITDARDLHILAAINLRK